jgi:hypothetical protein
MTTLATVSFFCVGFVMDREWLWDMLHCDGVAVGRVTLRRSGGVAEGRVTLRRSGGGTGYIATEWRRDGLHCDGVAVARGREHV